MELKAYYEAKPYRISQKWGIERPEVYGQFGFTAHNGCDFAHGRDSILRAPIPLEVIKHGNQPNGGGIFIGCISQHEYTFPDGKTCHILLDYLHMASIAAPVGARLEVGEKLGIQGNTGFSTGPHTHRQARRVLKTPSGFTTIDVNSANNTFDFDLYFTGEYAEDIILSKLSRQLKDLLAILTKLIRR